MRDDSSPVSVWREQERIGQEQVEAGVMILGTSGCSHFHAGGCSMCGYNFDSRGTVAPRHISDQFHMAISQLGEVKFLKVYTSGSFLDPEEVPEPCSDEILEHCAQKGLRLLFESRPEFVTQGRLEHVLSLHDDLEVALGLESSNDEILRNSINKGFSRADYERAANDLREKGVDIRTYVLLKPPFLTESEALTDAIATIGFAAEFSATISLNPVSVQKGTLVEKMWKTWSYRPPWLWTVLETLKSTSGTGMRVVCDPTGGGKERGAHNCGRCDDMILDSIRAYSLSQDASRLAWPECGCREQWIAVLDVEEYAGGGTSDLQRFFKGSRYKLH